MKNKITPEKIAKVVCEYYGIKLDLRHLTIYGGNRIEEYAVRFICLFVHGYIVGKYEFKAKCFLNVKNEEYAKEFIAFNSGYTHAEMANKIKHNFWYLTADMDFINIKGIIDNLK